MPGESEHQPFLCPECGSTEAGICMMLSIPFDPTDHDPWNDVLQTIECARCGFTIPAHLGQRWEGLSLEEAQREWQQVYRKPKSQSE